MAELFLGNFQILCLKGGAFASASHSGNQAGSAGAVWSQLDGDLCRVWGAAGLWGCPQNKSAWQQRHLVRNVFFFFFLEHLRRRAASTYFKLFWIQQLLLDLLQPGLSHCLLGHRAHGVLHTDRARFQLQNAGSYTSLTGNQRKHVLVGARPLPEWQTGRGGEHLPGTCTWSLRSLPSWIGTVSERCQSDLKNRHPSVERQGLTAAQLSTLPPVRASSTSESRATSLWDMKDRAVPGLSALAVLQKRNNRQNAFSETPQSVLSKRSRGQNWISHLPTRWMYDSTVVGKSKLMTLETFWKSTPLETPNSLSLLLK